MGTNPENSDDNSFDALVLRERDDGTYRARHERWRTSDLLDGDVTVDVEYSSLNYKDALALTGRGRIVRRLPLIPGIDLAGTVTSSSSADFRTGDKILLTGYGVGEEHHGGFAQQARVRSEWLVPIPRGLDARHAMAIGTAGFTAMLCIMALEAGGVSPEQGPVLVSGAGGGVGSLAVILLAGRGYEVTAVSGRPELRDYLTGLGASALLTREEMSRPPRPLESQRWAGAIDTVGSTMLARILAETRRYGTVAACGLAAGTDLPATVMPFILRGIRLQGISSVQTPMAPRRAAWERLAHDLPLKRLDTITEEVGLADLIPAANRMLEGRVRGRTIVNLKK
ncbi:MAG: MDR family oxidoreductase [Pseudomonadota bacterium]